MNANDVLNDVARFDFGGCPVLSFYLDIDGGRYSAMQCVERAHQLLRSARRQLASIGLSAECIASVEHDIDAVTKYCGTEIEWGRYRGLAIFACHSRAYWRAITLPASEPDQVFIEVVPCLRPLLELRQDYPHYAVALIDQRKARFFTVDLGEIKEHEPLKDNVDRRVHSGSYYGLSDKRMERHVDEQIDAHLKNTARQLDALFAENQPEFVVLGGTPNTLAGLRRVLSPNIEARVCSELQIPSHATCSEVFADSVVAVHACGRQAAGQLAIEVRDAAHGNGFGAQGIADTLNALHQRNVETLVVDRRFHVPGSRCLSCQRLYESPGECPACGSVDALPFGDVVEAAVHAALQQGAGIKHVFGVPDFREDGIGALLRFRLRNVPVIQSTSEHVVAA